MAQHQNMHPISGWNDRVDKVAMIILGSVSVLVAIVVMSGSGPSRITAEDILADVIVPEMMKKLTAEQKEKQVIKVTEGVYVAVGYALANVMLIEAPEGAIIVDTTENIEAGREILSALRLVNQQPIRAIIYTHSHPDHINGASVFLENATTPVEIWAHEGFAELVEEIAYTNEIFMKRSLRQFGGMLPVQVSAGIGASLKYDREEAFVNIGFVPPTRTYQGPSTEITIAGLNLRLVHIPGETEDQTGVWIERKKLLCSADDIYKAFPNLYAIRGTPARNAKHWFKSIDRMINLKPDIVVPMHGWPIYGSAHIQDVLQVYRDAIQFVHDQTLRYMNKGYLPDDIIGKIRLPAEFADKPYVYELYGNLEWSVRGIFNQYLGWFSGNPIELTTLSSIERAKRTVALAGGTSSILKSAVDAQVEGDSKWALELASHVLLLEPENIEAKQIRLESLKQLAGQQTSTNGRNYLLTTALEDYDLAQLAVSQKQRTVFIETLEMPLLFKSFQTRLIPEMTAGVNETFVLKFTDTDETFSWHFRRGILDIVPRIDDVTPVATMTTTTGVWRNIMSKTTSPLTAYAMGNLVIEGSLMAVRRFSTYFETN